MTNEYAALRKVKPEGLTISEQVVQHLHATSLTPGEIAKAIKEVETLARSWVRMTRGKDYPIPDTDIDFHYFGDVKRHNYETEYEQFPGQGLYGTSRKALLKFLLEESL